MNNTKSNFGKWGWSMIIYCAISYYIAAVLSTDTLNWFPSAFASLRGWGDNFVNLCNTMSGIGGWISVVAAIVFSIMAAKKGSRFMAVFGNIICGIVCIIFALTTNMTVFLIMIVLLTFVAGNIQLNVVPNNIMNIWFPHKKGLALGWASMGLPICTATIVLILSAIGNPQTAYIIIGIVCFVFAGVSIFWAKNTPEEVGATPDNEPINHEEAERLMKLQEAAAAKMTLKVIAKDRNTWLIGFGHGFLWMTTLGLVSNFVTKLCMVGIESGLAIKMLTVAAIVGIIGSYIWGLLDQKFGTKNASLIYAAWYVVALLLMIFQDGSMVMLYLVTFFVGFGIGGIGNLIPSIIGTCFGRYDYIQANKAIAPLNTIIRQFGIVLAGILSQTVYGYSGLYVILGIFDVVGIILVLTLIRENKEGVKVSEG